jgi:adenine-specific DNA-methyltransferase
VTPRTLLIDQEHGRNRDGTQELAELLGPRAFDNPKPLRLLKHLIGIGAPEKGDLILDFFAGSGTTGHATLELNREDGGERRFILVQLPEPTESKTNPTITDICESRIRQAIKRFNQVNDQVQSQALLFKTKNNIEDNGFRSFKLDTSNFKTWSPGPDSKPKGITEQLPLHVNNIKQGRDQESIFFELLLKSGFELSSRFTKIEVSGKTLFSAHEGALIVCLETHVSKELITHIAKLSPIRVICLDSGFAANDQLKVNAVETFKAKGITFKTV